jgi:hypothetical protein
MRRVRIFRNSVKVSRVLRVTVASFTLAGGVAFMATGPNFSLSSSHGSAPEQSSRKVEVVQLTSNVNSHADKSSNPSKSDNPGGNPSKSDNPGGQPEQ